ncbi:Response regulator PleD [Sulfitobacter indolifex]|uniref:diguanylate cyclase n=1 Tax=Sulfitobacter indolifex HEL-45 TaxID=391624 RepID=A0ABP2DA94_9RHOB|nr:diguanylate cyclase [Sulfitobacter indolifex]EDQ05192.1 diguanylate cyclase response regulator [Sulfitobacter indolifex HEL-45]UOA18240.1 Response regulator PleD [Sulfitobacter indolifex]
MQGTILIADAIATNRIALKVKLCAAFYQVVQAVDMEEALATARENPPDLVICALTLPGGGAADLCEALKASADTAQLPVLAIGNGDQTTGRLAALEAGASDVLLRPLDTTLLLGRARSLIRARNAAGEWEMRDDTTRALGLAEPSTEFTAQSHCVLIHSDSATSVNWAKQLRPLLRAGLTLANPEEAIRSASKNGPPDAYVLVLSEIPNTANAALRLISVLRANAQTRHAGLLVVQLTPDAAQAATALDLGADDLMTDGFNTAEMVLRLHAILRRKRKTDQLRNTVRTGLKAAVFDPLTGLHNRRYALPHLDQIAEHALETARPFAVMVADLDHFKGINDRYGHAAGDSVLVQTAERLRNNLRGMDLVARIGGEEFLIVMPGTNLSNAESTAADICSDIGNRGFVVPGTPAPVHVTISIGLSIGPMVQDGSPLSAEALMAQADRALYSAKSHGRNQVNLSRPAA